VTDVCEGGSELTFSLQVRGVHFGVKGIESLSRELRAEIVPVQYSPDGWTELANYRVPMPKTPTPAWAAWRNTPSRARSGRARGFVVRECEDYLGMSVNVASTISGSS
jgi:hypothetical protein